MIDAILQLCSHCFSLLWNEVSNFMVKYALNIQNIIFVTVPFHKSVWLSSVGLFTFVCLFVFVLWGQYCIYKKGDCPKGFSEGYIFFDDENHKNINDKGGELPDGEYNKDTNISYCCRTDGDKLKPITLPVMSPFYLMAYNTSECQRVKGALATEEFIRYHNQYTDNKDSMNGTHPYEEGKENITITYCYYERKYSQRSKTGNLECILTACSITNKNYIYPTFEK